MAQDLHLARRGRLAFRTRRFSGRPCFHQNDINAARRGIDASAMPTEPAPAMAMADAYLGVIQFH
jgi:hypothetical protein